LYRYIEAHVLLAAPKHLKWRVALVAEVGLALSHVILQVKTPLDGS
jgi:hypothetical protein